MKLTEQLAEACDMTPIQRDYISAAIAEALEPVLQQMALQRAAYEALAQQVKQRLAMPG